MKKCTKCGKLKRLEDFYKRRSGVKNKHSKESNCKDCCSKRNLTNSRSKRGKALTLFRSQIRRTKINGLPDVSYSKTDFIDWLFSNDKYIVIYDKWVKSGYDKMKAPSIDRIDDYMGYSFDNIIVTTWEENKLKYHKDSMNGVNTKQSRSVVKMDLIGRILDLYHSMKNASRETGVEQSNIWKACNGKIKTSGGFKWRYLDAS